MALTYYKAATDLGGTKGSQIFSGDINTLFGEITQAEQLSGATVSRKFYIANSEASDVLVSALSMDAVVIFDCILFESSGDTQIVTDLTGAETDESPINVIIPASSHKSFWLVIDVPALSTETASYGSIDVKQVL